MRPLTIAILLLGMAMIFFLMWQRQRVPTQSEIHPDNLVTLTDSPPIFANLAPSPGIVATKAAANPPALPPATVFTPENPPSPEIIAEKVQQLEALGMNDDAASLNTILSELKNPEPQIREAARDAAVQFGDPAAIPALKQAAEQTTNVDDKIHLLQAVKFLELPPFRVPQPN